MADNNYSANAQDLSSAQGQFGVLSQYIPQILKSNDDTARLVDQQMGALSNMRSVDPAIAFGSAMLKPTFGGFAASLGNAGEAYYGALNQQRSFDLDKMQKMMALQEAKQKLSYAPLELYTKIGPYAQAAYKASLASQEPSFDGTGSAAPVQGAGASAPQMGGNGAAMSADAQGAPAGNVAGQGAGQPPSSGISDFEIAKRRNQYDIQRALEYRRHTGDDSMLKAALEDQNKLFALDPALRGAQAGAEASAKFPFEAANNPLLASQVEYNKQSASQAANPDLVEVMVGDHMVKMPKSQYIALLSAQNNGAGGTGGAGAGIGNGVSTGLTPTAQEAAKANIERDAALGKEFDQDAFKFNQNVASQENEIGKIASIYKEYQPNRWAEQKANLVGAAVAAGILPANSDVAKIQQGDFDTALKLSMDQALKKQQESGGSRAPASFLKAAQQTVGGPTVAPGAARDVLALTLANHNYLKDLYGGYDFNAKPNVNAYTVGFNKDPNHVPAKYLRDAYNQIGVFKGMDLPAPKDRVHGVQYPTSKGVGYWDAKRQVFTNIQPE